MAVDQVIRQRVLDALDIRRQSLDGRAKTFQKKLPISKEDAIYLVAFREGIQIDDRLDPDVLERIGRYHRQLADALTQAPTQSAEKPRRPSRMPREVVVKLAGMDVDSVPGLSPAHAREAKQMAEKVYPILYVFENSVRDVIEHVLEEEFGNDWWEEASWSALRSEVKRRQAKEDMDAWHSKRGTSPLAYLDLSHLVEIVTKPRLWPLFEEIFSRQGWFEGVVGDLTVSRRVIAHMNPLTDEDIRQVEAGFRRWVRQIKAKSDLIP